jgi:hypothetical protein
MPPLAAKEGVELRKARCSVLLHLFVHRYTVESTGGSVDAVE